MPEQEAVKNAGTQTAQTAENAETIQNTKNPQNAKDEKTAPTVKEAQNTQTGKTAPAAKEAQSVRETKNVPDAQRAPKEKTRRSTNLDALIATVEDAKTRDYIENRVVDQMEYYSRSGQKAKKIYDRLNIAVILVGAAIPVASVFSNAHIIMKTLIAALGAAVTAINAILATKHYKDLWVSYRNARENLLRTLYYYFNETGSFKGKDAKEKNILLVDTCEEIMGRENGSWDTLYRKRNTTDESN